MTVKTAMKTKAKEALKLLYYANDPVAFCRDILGLEVKWFHEEWLRFFEKNRFCVLLAPRGFGKTTIVGGYIIWRIVRDPDIRILIVTINQNKGQSGIAHKEPTLEVLGVDSKMISGHYDLIVLDDITDYQNSRTEHRRRQLEEWYSQILLPMLLPDGQIIDIGTRWHQADIHAWLMQKPMFKSKVYRAIIDEEKKIVLWPERFPYETLVSIRNQIGRARFAMQYQNEFISPEDAVIKWDWIRYYDEAPQNLRRYMGVDMAAASQTSDYFVICVIGIADNGDVYVLDLLRTKATLFRQFDLIKEMYAKWQPSKIGIEANAMQKLITDELRRTTTLPIVPLKFTGDKASRVERLSVLFETGRIFLKEDQVDLIDELLAFPRGKNDDCIDALAFALEASHSQKFDWNEAIKVLSINKLLKVEKIEGR